MSDMTYIQLRSEHTMDIFDTDYEAPKREKVPTLGQFLKTLPKKTKVLEQIFTVEWIWLPGKFNNVTLQTHAFRLILNDSHPLFDEFVKSFSSDDDNRRVPCFGIQITDRDTQAFRLSTQSKNFGGWKVVGTTGRQAIFN